MKKIYALLLYASFVFSAHAQIQLGQDIDGEAAGDASGFSVSVSGDGSIVALGATYNKGNGINAGNVRVFKFTAGAWTQLGSDIDGEAAYDISGWSVSMSSDGSIVAIGARRNDVTGGIDVGHVRVYRFASGKWTQLGSDIDGEAAGDISGNAVSMSSDGSIVAIGAPYNDGNGADAGHVRVYKFLSGVWTQLGSDIDGEAAGDQSGMSVSLSGDGSILSIGAPLNNGNGSGAGHVRIYKYSAGIWSQLGSDIDGEAKANRSGESVSISSDGSVVAIGVRYNNGNGSGAGHVRIYKYSAGIWSQLGSDIDGEAAGDASGYTVSLSADSNIVAIGAPNNDGNGSNAGHVRVYKYVAGSWTKLSSDIDGEATGDWSGYSVSLSADGRTVAIGAIENDGNGSASGHVRVMEFKNCPLDTTTESIVACGTYTWKDGKTYTSSNKTACRNLVKKNGCDSIIRLNLTLLFPNERLLPKICAVSVDSASGKNEVIWEKYGLNRAVNYNIYRENSSSQFVKIGMVHKDSFSTFIDTGSKPLTQAYKYKLTITDSCKNETSIDSSSFHKTIHLTSNIGVNGEVNLIWNLYEGKAYTSHEIMRSTNGGSFVKIGQVAAGNNSFSDITPPSGTLVYIIRVSSTACRPSRSNYNAISSNPVYVRSTAIITHESNRFSLKPNPASNTLEINSLDEMTQIELLDPMGRIVFTKFVSEYNAKIDISSLCTGIYLVRVTANNKIFHIQRLIKE